MFNGRYGADKLGFIMVTASIILTVIAAFLRAGNFFMRIILLVLSGGTIAFCIFRVFSVNIKARKRELRAFRIAENKVLSIFGRHTDTDEDEEEPQSEKKEEEAPPQVSQVPDEYRHFRCPRCKRSLKVPAGKGYIKVVCPTCSYRFMKHT